MKSMVGGVRVVQLRRRADRVPVDEPSMSRRDKVLARLANAWPGPRWSIPKLASRKRTPAASGVARAVVRELRECTPGRCVAALEA
jgi:hypothetical protein